MNIRKISNEGMDEITRYNLINGDGSAGLSTAAGSVLEVEDYVIYDTIDINTNDEKTVLSLVTKDGEFFATNSATCVDAFEKIISSFKKLPNIEFYKGVSKKGREFLACRPVK